jgi:hypothetical protein
MLVPSKEAVEGGKEWIRFSHIMFVSRFSYIAFMFGVIFAQAGGGNKDNICGQMRPSMEGT